MKIKRVRGGRNEFNWEGLTIGQMLVLQRSLMTSQISPHRSTLGKELLEFLRRKVLVDVEPYGKEPFL